MSSDPGQSRQLAPTKRRSMLVGQVVGAFESETANALLKAAPQKERLVIYVLGTMLTLSIVLMAVINIDRIVMGPGRIMPAGGELYVSPLDSGIIREIRVKSGDIVRKGQVLATFEATFTDADRKQLTEKLASDVAHVERLEAELAGVPYTPKLRDTHHLLQLSIWSERKAQVRSDLADLEAQIRASQSQVRQYQADVREYHKRLELAQSAEKVYEPLLEKGYVSKLQLMQASDATAEARRLVDDAESQESQYRQNLQSVISKRDSYLQKWRSDAGTELVAVRSDASDVRQSLTKATRLNELIELKAPAEAVVLNVAHISVGSVASTAPSNVVEPLFTLVPIGIALEANIEIPSRDVGFIKVGDPVQLKLDAYQYIRHGIAKGHVSSISEGSFTVSENNAPTDPYFKVRIYIDAVNLRNVPSNFRLIPGMTLTGDILVGHRTILSYLVEGVIRTGNEGMREPQ